MQRREAYSLCVNFRDVIAVLVLEFENFLLFIGIGSIFKELRAPIEAYLLVLAYCHQSVSIRVNNIHKVDAVLHCRSDRVVILEFDLELSLVDDLFVLSLILDKGQFVLGNVKEVNKLLLDVARIRLLRFFDHLMVLRLWDLRLRQTICENVAQVSIHFLEMRAL